MEPAFLKENLIMSRLATVCLIIAVVAAFSAFTGITGEFAWAAKTFFFVFLVLAVASFLAGMFRDRGYWDA
jgi:uncharacterized membrane protein YtjA (UPF0391 family)